MIYISYICNHKTSINLNQLTYGRKLDFGNYLDSRRSQVRLEVTLTRALVALLVMFFVT